MKIIFPTLFLFAVHTAFGQKIHEIKADLLMPFVPGAHLAYEFIPQKRLGVELEARYRWKVDGYYINYSSCFECFEINLSAQKVLTLNLNAKFYFLKNSTGSGAYAGAYVRGDWWLSRRDPDYKYFSIPDYYLGGQSSAQDRNLRNSIGLLAGYKFLLWKRWALEASMGLDWDYRWLFGDRIERDWTGIPSLKAGYRL